MKYDRVEVISGPSVIYTTLVSSQPLNTVGAFILPVEVCMVSELYFRIACQMERRSQLTVSRMLS